MIARCEGPGLARYQCMTCGKTMADRSKMKRHAEVHLDSAHNCIVCQRVFKTRNSLSVHYSQAHKHEVSSPWATQ
jgi:DNA-directed RNA polymerase subunit RPC12/RpoP